VRELWKISENREMGEQCRRSEVGQWRRIDNWEVGEHKQWKISKNGEVREKCRAVEEK